MTIARQEQHDKKRVFVLYLRLSSDAESLVQTSYVDVMFESQFRQKQNNCGFGELMKAYNVDNHDDDLTYEELRNYLYDAQVAGLLQQSTKLILSDSHSTKVKAFLSDLISRDALCDWISLNSDCSSSH